MLTADISLVNNSFLQIILRSPLRLRFFAACTKDTLAPAEKTIALASKVKKSVCKNMTADISIFILKTCLKNVLQITTIFIIML